VSVTARPLTREPQVVPAQESCIACGALTGAPRDGDRDALAGLGLGRCSSCGLRWLVDQPDSDQLTALYSSGFYEPQPARAGALVGAIHAANSWLRMRELDGLPPGRLLDVGSGKGHFLAAAAAAGWDVVGVELAGPGARETQERYGLPVVLGDIRDVEFDGRFDAVTLWHVLEHLADPDAVLDRVRGFLVPGGRIVVSVPNLASVQAQLFGRVWFHLDLPRHIYHFTPAAVRSILERHGFAIERLSTAYPEMEVLGLVQSTLNAAGFESDRLYRFVKRDPTVSIDAPTLASFGLAAAMIPAALAWTLIAPLLGTGASLQVRATSA
jgi:SAM-dependent methyltransferase